MMWQTPPTRAAMRSRAVALHFPAFAEGGRNQLGGLGAVGELHLRRVVLLGQRVHLQVALDVVRRLLDVGRVGFPFLVGVGGGDVQAK